MLLTKMVPENVDPPRDTVPAVPSNTALLRGFAALTKLPETVAEDPAGLVVKKVAFVVHVPVPPTPALVPLGSQMKLVCACNEFATTRVVSAREKAMPGSFVFMVFSVGGY